MSTRSNTLASTLHALLLFGVAVSLVSAAQQPSPPTSLTRPASPTRLPDADGFLQRWLILEPIRVPGQLSDSAIQAVVKKEYFFNQLTVVPKDNDTVTVGDEQLAWHAVDTGAYNVNLFHFARRLNKPTSNVLFWIVTVVNTRREMPKVRLAIGSNAASVWWVNDSEVIALYNDRQTVIDDGVSKRLPLKQGPNIVRAAIVNAGGATDFCARFLDETDRPIKDINVSLAANGSSVSRTSGSPRGR
jgi:hypothetical protein